MDLSNGLIINFPLYFLKFHPRKSKPSWMDVSFVFSSDRINPLCSRNSFSIAFMSINVFLSESLFPTLHKDIRFFQRPLPPTYCIFLTIDLPTNGNAWGLPCSATSIIAMYLDSVYRPEVLCLSLHGIIVTTTAQTSCLFGLGVSTTFHLFSKWRPLQQFTYVNHIHLFLAIE